MINSKNLAGESGSANSFAFTLAAFAVCATLVMGAVLLAPAEAISHVSATTAHAAPIGYFPAQFVNQAKEIAPMPEMYY